MASDVTDVFLNTNEFAKTVTYYENDAGDGVSITAVWYAGVSTPGLHTDGRTRKDWGILSVSKTDVDENVVPYEEHTFYIDSTKYAVDEIADQDDDMIKLQLVRIEVDKLGGGMGRLEH